MDPKQRPVTADEVDVLPEDTKRKMLTFKNALASFKARVCPLYEDLPSFMELARDDLDTTLMDLTSVYVANALYWVYLVSKGVNPKEHEVMKEFSRLKTASGRLNDKRNKRDGIFPAKIDPKKPSINVDAARRVIKHSLYDSNNPGHNNKKIRKY